MSTDNITERDYLKSVDLGQNDEISYEGIFVRVFAVFDDWCL